ncbi:MAG: hypothetical protein ABL986_05950 [Vicinamibacterales bacterium]
MMSNRMFSRLMMAAAFALCCSPLQAGELDRPTPVNERLRDSAAVVVATARQVDATWKPGPTGDQIIVTRVLLEVTETLKGDDQSSRWLDVPGGTLEGVTLKVSGELTVREGDRGVFFLDPANGGIHSAHGKAEALLRLDQQDTVKGTTIRLDDIRRIAAKSR